MFCHRSISQKCISAFRKLKRCGSIHLWYHCMGENQEGTWWKKHSALERLAHIGLHLNVEKYMFKQRQINYLVELITENSVYPDPEKVKAIAEMKAPSDKAQLQWFLGMVTYVGRFIPNLSVFSTPLRALIIRAADWEWNKEQKVAFEYLKQLMPNNPVLQFYDDTKPIKVSTDLLMHARVALVQWCCKSLIMTGCPLLMLLEHWVRVNKTRQWLKKNYSVLCLAVNGFIVMYMAGQ